MWFEVVGATVHGADLRLAVGLAETWLDVPGFRVQAEDEPAAYAKAVLIIDPASMTGVRDLRVRRLNRKKRKDTS